MNACCDYLAAVEALHTRLHSCIRLNYRSHATLFIMLAEHIFSLSQSLNLVTRAMPLCTVPRLEFTSALSSWSCDPKRLCWLLCRHCWRIVYVNTVARTRGRDMSRSSDSLREHESEIHTRVTLTLAKQSQPAN